MHLHYDVLFGRGLVVKYILTILTSVSFQDCQNECAWRTTCELVVYERRLQLCELHTNMAKKPENIVKVPGSTVVTNIDTCDSCTRDISECPHPEKIGYKLHRGNMFSVGSSVQVLLPLLETPMRATCLSNGDWRLDPGPGYCPDCRDCTDIQELGYTESAIYFVTESSYFLCTFDDSGDAWLTFQERYDGSVNFYKNWKEYVYGFGFMEGEFWFGLEKLYRILNSDNYELRVDLEQFDGARYNAQYSTFDLTDASDNYRISVGGFTGTAGDSFSSHNGMQFTTYDRDNDNEDTDGNCAVKHNGAWWFDHCHNSSLNGRYFPSGELTDGPKYVQWTTLTGYHRSLKKTEMKIKRRLP